MSKIRHYLKLVQKKKLWVLSGAALIIAGLLLTNLRGNGGGETVALAQEDLVRTVKISGKVAPREKVDLAFEIGGTVSFSGKASGALVSRGETLARLSSGGIAAELAKAEAELASARAELNKLEGVQVYENSITNKKRSVVQAIKDSYTAASDAIYNKSDQLFVDPESVNPQIAGNFEGQDALLDSVNRQRLEMGPLLENWQKLIGDLGPASYTEAQLELSKAYLARVAAFISDLSRAVNLFETTSYMSQATIEEYKADMLAARENLSQAAQDFIASENDFSNTLADVPVQMARVEAARASVENLRFQLGKTALSSPISGIVARQDAKVGQSVTAGESLISVISLDYIIEAYVPEVSIAGLREGNAASVTLDAYGNAEIFEAEVSKIDPAETVRDGVSTYKVTLVFKEKDARARSGMTANVEIETFRKSAALLLPERALLKENGKAFVTVLRQNRPEKIEVVSGERDSRGNVEILSGLTTSDLVLINPLEE